MYGRLWRLFLLVPVLFLLVEIVLLSVLGTSITHAQTTGKAQTAENSVPAASAAKAVSSILVIGDSISAAFGIDKQKGWVSLLQNYLGEGVTVTNASISGDTSSGGRYRIQAALKSYQPDLVIIELGGNDGLRGTPIPLIRANLKEMTKLSQAAGAQVILAGMQIPPNYGERYTSAFRAMYQAVADEMGASLIPFLMDGVAGVEGMMQDDGIHPTEAAQVVMKRNVLNVLNTLLP